MKKIYIFIADGVELAEALLSVDLLRRANFEVITIGIEGKKVTSSNDVCFYVDKHIDDEEYLDADAIVLPGGVPGVYNLATSKKLENIIIHYAENKKLLAAICAAPYIFSKYEIMKDKKLTCYPGFEDKFIYGKYTGKSVEVDENLITANGLGMSFEFNKEIMKLLGNKDLADEVLDSIMYQ